MASKAAVRALRGEAPPPKPRNVYSGKTYNSTEAIAEFFKTKGSGGVEEKGSGGDVRKETETWRHGDAETARPETPFDRLKAAGTQNPQSATRLSSPKSIHDPQSLVPGSHVIHGKYGRGLVLRREGSGDNAKLTVSFAGFGQKKLIEKYANLQKV